MYATEMIILLFNLSKFMLSHKSVSCRSRHTEICATWFSDGLYECATHPWVITCKNICVQVLTQECFTETVYELINSTFSIYFSVHIWNLRAYPQEDNNTVRNFLHCSLFLSTIHQFLAPNLLKSSVTAIIQRSLDLPTIFLLLVCSP